MVNHKKNNNKKPPANKEPALSNAGLKVTLPRIKVLDLFRSNPSRHLSADDAHRLLRENNSDVAIATVYRVLSDLEAVGLLARNVFDAGKAVYELNTADHHDHLVCLTCGQVDEFTNDAIEALQQQAAEAMGYRLMDHRLALYGHCPTCLSKKMC